MGQIYEKEILLVDDDKMHLSIFSDRLKNMGFKNVIVANGYKKGAELLDSYVPDLVILDHYLDDSKTSIDFAKNFLVGKGIPFIVISTFFTEKVFDEVKTISPLDFLSKSCVDFEFMKSIQLAFNKSSLEIQTSKLKDFFFVKVGKNIKKINLSQIEMISVDGKYLNINFDGRVFIVRSALVDFIKRLPGNFVKVHQSYIVNLNFVESILVEEGKIKLKTCQADFSRSFKKQLLNSYYVS